MLLLSLTMFLSTHNGPLRRGVWSTAVLLAGLCPVLVWAQMPDDLTRERHEYTAWLLDAPNSPFAAVVLRPVGPGLTLGPSDAAIPLAGVALSELTESGRLGLLKSGGRQRVIPRLRNVALGKYRIYLSGPPGHAVLTVYGPRTTPRKAPTYFPYDASLSLRVTLNPPQKRGQRRILASDGTEVEATEAGTVIVSVGGTSTTLRVLRIPIGTGDESELEIYFRDETNGKTTYPAGRFVTLLPVGGGGGGRRYRLDFNRARNSFCAYNTVYACPAPWRGNTLATPIQAGEQYTGGGLEVPLPKSEP